MDSTPAAQEPSKKSPKDFASSVNLIWFTEQIGWPYPVWMDHETFYAEFFDTNDGVMGQRLLDAINNLKLQIDKAFAGNRVTPSIEFKYYRKISENARKLRPLKLKATLYQHPEYGKVWMYVEPA